MLETIQKELAEYRIIRTFGGYYSIEKRWLFWWADTPTPFYHTLDDAEAALLKYVAPKETNVWYYRKKKMNDRQSVSW